MSGTIELGSPELVDDSTVRVEFEVSRELRRYFRAGELTVSYDLSVRDVSPGILVIPLLANIAPLAWVFDAEIRSPVCDETYLSSLVRVRAALQALYPGLSLAGSITASDAVATQISAPNGTGLLFSGGVDSTASAIAHQDEDLHLFTVVISDRHEELPENVRAIAEVLGAVHHAIHAPILEGLLDREHLSQLFKSQFLDWWSGIQHGLGLTGVCAPATAALKLNPLYLASSDLEEGEAWGSHPTTDNQVAWSGTHVSYDSQGGTRLLKIDALVDFVRSESQSIPVSVCDSPTNCGECEKCVRTMTALILRGMRPDAFGFPWISGMTPGRLEELTSRDNFIREWSAIEWIEMSDAIGQSDPLDELGVTEYVEHLHALPIEEMVKRYERRARIFRTLNSWTHMVPSPVHRRLHAVARRLLGRWV